MALTKIGKRTFYVVFITLGLVSCKDEGTLNEASPEKKITYDMYEPSEMAGFMNALYTYNQQLKAQIVAGETPTAMPLDLLKMHTAEMTDGKSRTKNWQSFVNVFIESQEAISDTLSKAVLKERFNTAINNCLSCHKTECTGPIPKIKKLLIQ